MYIFLYLAYVTMFSVSKITFERSQRCYRKTKMIRPTLLLCLDNQAKQSNVSLARTNEYNVQYIYKKYLVLGNGSDFLQLLVY